MEMLKIDNIQRQLTIGELTSNLNASKAQIKMSYKNIQSDESNFFFYVGIKKDIFKWIKNLIKHKLKPKKPNSISMITSWLF